MKQHLKGIAAFVLTFLSLAALTLTASAAAETLFFTVSRIDFSLVGEKEDIYIGTVPRDKVTWESANPAVAAFDGGVLEATGVGSTTVTATFENQKIEIAVGCLADSQESLKALPAEVLRSPKRYGPVVDESNNVFFRDAGILGDSISYIMYQNEQVEGILGYPKFLVRGGVSLNGFVLRYKNLYFQGTEQYIEDVVAGSGVKKLFIMLGQNDLSYRTIDETFGSWDIMLERIREKTPEIEIYLESCVPEWHETGKGIEKNRKIDDYNVLLKQYAKDNDCHFVDIAPYIEDHTNNMATVYSLDKSIHMNREGCVVWMNALNAYAYWVSIGGEAQ